MERREALKRIGAAAGAVAAAAALPADASVPTGPPWPKPFRDTWSNVPDDTFRWAIAGQPPVSEDAPLGPSDPEYWIEAKDDPRPDREWEPIFFSLERSERLRKGERGPACKLRFRDEAEAIDFARKTLIRPERLGFSCFGWHVRVLARRPLEPEQPARIVWDSRRDA